MGFGNLRELLEKAPVEDPDAALEAIAQHIVVERLTPAAIALLEGTIPFSTVAGNAAVVATPLLGAFLEPMRLHKFAALIGDRDFLRRLIARVEELEAERAGR